MAKIWVFCYRLDKSTIFLRETLMDVGNQKILNNQKTDSQEGSYDVISKMAENC